MGHDVAQHLVQVFAAMGPACGDRFTTHEAVKSDART
jgi:hypothetical protein